MAEAAKARVAASGRTFTSLVAEALRIVLHTGNDHTPAEPLPATGDPGDRFLVDPADRDALWAALDANGPS